MRSLQAGAGEPGPAAAAQGLQQAQVQFSSFAADLALLLDHASGGAGLAEPAAADEGGEAAVSSAAPEVAAAAAVAPGVCQLLVSRGMWSCCRLLDPGFFPPEATSAAATPASSSGSASSIGSRQGQLEGGSAQQGAPAALSSSDQSSSRQGPLRALPARAGAAAQQGDASAPPPPPPPASQGLCCSLLRGFQPPATEARYLRHKQQRYAYLDACSAAFTGAYLLSVLGRMVRERDVLAGVPVAVVMVCKLLPYAVMLADKPAFMRHREALVAAPEVFKVCLMVLALLGVLPLPKGLLKSLSRSRGDVVVTGLLRPLLQHLRFRVHALVVLLEAATMPCMFHSVVGSWRAVAVRFGLSYGLSLAVGAALDGYARRQFAAGEGVRKAE
jgi:hypothetical protein